ncbi:MAG: STAS domain-containing protein [Phycisphaerae bacterium]
MKISEQLHGPVTVLTPHGPMISEELADFRNAVERATAARATRTVLDMSDVPYVDSAGIESLLNYCGSQVLPLKRVKLAGLLDCCREALDVTDVLGKLEAFNSVDDAIRSCKR